MQAKTVFKICEGISCSSFYVKEFDVIVHEKYNPIKFLAILYPKSLANLVVEMGTRHSRQILLDQLVQTKFPRCLTLSRGIYLKKHKVIPESN